MTEGTRYRMTGSLFLIAVATIVLAMLFDGAGLEPVEPPRPQPASDAPRALPEAERALIEPSILSEAQALREAIDEEGFDTARGTRLGDPVLAAEEAGPADGGPAWAVQLASFSDRANAVALRDRLRADGYEALLSDAREQGRDGGSVSTRVAIGPIIARDDAVELQHEISQRYELAPIVVELDP